MKFHSQYSENETLFPLLQKLNTTTDNQIENSKIVKEYLNQKNDQIKMIIKTMI